MKLAWLEHTRPDLTFEISQKAQVTRTVFERDPSEHCESLNKAIKYAHHNIASICIPKLDLDTLRVVAYSDAAFANNIDLSQQLMRIVPLTDVSNKAIAVSYKSYKSRRVARSVLSAEVSAFADLTDDALAIRKQLEFILIQPVPVHILTDSKSLSDIISKKSRTYEKRIMLNIYAARQAYKAKGIKTSVS